MSIAVLTARRPLTLWIITCVYAFIAVINLTMELEFQAQYEDWPVLNRLASLCPSILAVVGVAAFVLLKRWAIYPFGILVAIGLYDIAVDLLLFRGATVFPEFLWLRRVVALVPPVVALLYGVRLRRRGVLH